MEVTKTTTATHPRGAGAPTLRAGRVGEILGAWQQGEVRLAQSFAECRGLSREHVEDLYQETVIALLSRPYASEEHLRNALRQGIRHRALNVHRDARRRGQIIAEHAPSMHRLAEATAAGFAPESMALRGEERGVVLEFLAELDPLERQVFELTAEGLRYRAIAKRLGVDVNEARRTVRTVERKRVLFRMRHELDWEPHVRARAKLLVLTPAPLLAAGFTAARRWLFGTSGAAKAAAVLAAGAVLVAGTIDTGKPAHRKPDQPPVTRPPADRHRGTTRSRRRLRDAARRPDVRRAAGSSGLPDPVTSPAPKAHDRPRPFAFESIAGLAQREFGIESGSG